MTDDPVIREMAAAVERSPDVVPLRYAEALGQCSAALAQDATNTTTLKLLQRCSATLAGISAATPAKYRGAGRFDDGGQ